MDLKQPNLEHKISPEAWAEIEFQGKSFCLLRDGYLLILKRTDFSPERTLSSIGSDNAETIIKSLVEKFGEVTEQMNELEMEWSASEDPLRMEQKISRFKEYLFHVNAVGDFAPLFLSLQEKLAVIQQTYEKNYQKRLEIVAQAEHLAQPASSGNTEDSTPVHFSALIEAWKSAPEIRKEKYDALSTRFDKARNAYYENRRKSQEAWEHELMQNLDRKMEICEKAAQLSQSDAWRQTTEDFKQLLEDWKQIGPVPSTEKNEALWQRFSDARNLFFQRKKENYEKIQNEQEENLRLKLALVTQAEALQHETSWKETSAAFAEIMKEWKKIGKVPFEDAAALWDRLQKARDTFFSAKRESSKNYKATLASNYEKKQLLANHADAVKDSTDWHGTTQMLNEWMKEWKSIGPIPREYGDEVWEKFIAARKHFFDRKDADRAQRNARFQHKVNNRLHQTTQFLNKITAELAEEEEKLADFKTSLADTVGTSSKEEELRQHLRDLIQQIEEQLPRRRAKIEEVKKQKAELTDRCKAVNGKKKENDKLQTQVENRNE